MNKAAFLLVTMIIALVTGCASVPMASLDKDTKAKDFLPPQNKASIYIYRNETFGGAIPITMSINDLMIGQTAAMSYFRFDVNPGKYIVKAHAENVDELGIFADSGKNYFIWQEMKMGMWTARAKLTQVDESVGREGVLESKLIASSVSNEELESTTVVSAPGGATTSGIDLSASQKLRELKKLKEDGVITDEEFEDKKEQLLNAL